MSDKIYAHSLGYRKFPIVDADGHEYMPVRSSSEVSVGDVAFLGKRSSRYCGDIPMWELYEMTIEKDSLYSIPRLWYGLGKFVFLRVK